MGENDDESLYFMKKDIWQRSFALGIRVIRMTEKLPNQSSTWVLSKQIIRSATSIAANIAEGSGGISRAEFARYMTISQKSALETYNWLLCIEEVYGLGTQMKGVKQECLEIVKILSTIVKNTRQGSSE